MKFKKVLSICLVFLLMIHVSGCSVQNTDIETKTIATIIVDPGHGGMDSGMIAEDGTFEKDINLAIALKIQEQMKDLNPEIEVLLTRETDDIESAETDEILNLRYRTDFAKNHNADYFISIHCDSFGQDTDVCGYTGHYNSKDKKSADVFYLIEKNFEKIHWGPSRGLKDENEVLFQVIEEAEMPSLLLEVGFLTNPLDLMGLKDAEYQTKIASAIAKAYCSTIIEK